MSESDIWILFFWSNLFPHLQQFDIILTRWYKKLTKIFLHFLHRSLCPGDAVKGYGRCLDYQERRQGWPPPSVCSSWRWCWPPAPCPRVPELQLELPLLRAVHPAVVVQPHRGLAVSGRGEGVAHEPPEQRGFPHTVLTAQDHLLLGNFHWGLTMTFEEFI